MIGGRVENRGRLRGSYADDCTVTLMGGQSSCLSCKTINTRCKGGPARARRHAQPCCLTSKALWMTSLEC